MLKYGIIYAATTLKYCKEVIKSARNVKLHNPDLSITLHTDKVDHATKVNQKHKLFDNIIPIDMNLMKKKKYKLVPFAKLSKIKAMKNSPYDVSLYLDTDTKVVKPIMELFAIGEKYDICIANSPFLDKSRIPYKLKSFVRPRAYNSGVVVFRKGPVVDKLFTQWIKLCKKDKNMYLGKSQGIGKFYDQPKLVKLLNAKNSKINLKVIPNTVYNARHTMLSRIRQKGLMGRVKIIHKHGA